MYRLLTWITAGQGLSFDRNSKDVEILSEIYLQSVQVASPTVTDYGGLSKQQKGTVAKANQRLFSDLDAVTFPPEEQEMCSWAPGDVGALAAPTCSRELGHKPIQPQALPAPAAEASPDVHLLFLSVNKKSANPFQY